MCSSLFWGDKPFPTSPPFSVYKIREKATGTPSDSTHPCPSQEGNQEKPGEPAGGSPFAPKQKLRAGRKKVKAKPEAGEPTSRFTMASPRFSLFGNSQFVNS